MRKLEIGPGDHPVPGEGWERVEWATNDNPRWWGPTVGRWGYHQLQLVSGSFDLVYASHVLEHVPYTRTEFALKDVLRILKPSGTLEVWVPDVAYLVQCYIEQKCGDNWRRDNPDGDYFRWFVARLYTYGPEPNYHHSAFDETNLRKQLELSGFVDVQKLSKPRGYDHGPINLGMSGRKPA